MRTSGWTIPTFVTLACVLIAPLAAACEVQVGTSKTVSQSDLEQQAIDSLTKTVGHRPDSVTCDGGVDAKVGASQRCVLSSGGGKVGLTATVTNVTDDKVDVSFQVDDKPMPS